MNYEARIRIDGILISQTNEEIKIFIQKKDFSNVDELCLELVDRIKTFVRIKNKND